MGRLTTIILLFVACGVSAQVSMDYVIGSNTITIIEFNTELGAKLIQKRFDLAVIGKDINEVTNNCKEVKKQKKQDLRDMGYSEDAVNYSYRYYCDRNWFIEIEEGDEYEYFKFIGLKIYCLPKRLRKRLLTFEIERI